MSRHPLLTQHTGRTETDRLLNRFLLDRPAGE